MEPVCTPCTQGDHPACVDGEVARQRMEAGWWWSTPPPRWGCVCDHVDDQVARLVAQEAAEDRRDRKADFRRWVGDGPCSLCGALVPDTGLDLHARWHLHLAERIERMERRVDHDPS